MVFLCVFMLRLFRLRLVSVILLDYAIKNVMLYTIGPLHDPVTWYGINYTGTQITKWDFQNKGKSGWTGVSSFGLEVPLRNLRPSVIYSVPCDRIVQRAYWVCSRWKGWVMHVSCENAIHWINHYPADSVVCFVNTYPVDSVSHVSNNWGLTFCFNVNW